MKCAGCGADLLDGSRFCQRCGKQLSGPPLRLSNASRSREEGGRTVLMIVVVAVVLVVATASIGTVIYLYMLGVGGSAGTPTLSLTKSEVEYGQRVTVVSISSETSWSDVSIGLSYADRYASWSPSADELRHGPGCRESLGARNLGDIKAFLNVTDIAGNGVINSGDYFTVTTGSAETFDPMLLWMIAVIYEPTSIGMGSV